MVQIKMSKNNNKFIFIRVNNNKFMAAKPAEINNIVIIAARCENPNAKNLSVSYTHLTLPTKRIV